MFTRKDVEENKEGVIEEFEKLAQENPKVFRFLLSKYANIVFDSMPWAELWADEPFQQTVWEKLSPILVPIMLGVNIVVGVVAIIILK